MPTNPSQCLQVHSFVRFFPGTGLEKTSHGNDCVITEMDFLVELKEMATSEPFVELNEDMELNEDKESDFNGEKPPSKKKKMST